MLSSSLVYPICLVAVCIAAPLATKEETPALDEQPSHITEYLHRYGYLRTPTPNAKQLRTALIALQDVLGLPQSGEVDLATEKAIRQPRCAAADVSHTGASRKKRFVLAGASRWADKHFNGDELHLKWYISRYTRDMPKSTIRNTVIKAFETWSSQFNMRALPEVTIKFTEASSEEDADINILWAERKHGDKFEFDGEGTKDNVLAHTFFPDYEFPLNGDIHFDDAEKWDTDPTKNTFFPYVLAHEIGHALGLQHSKREKAIMHPLYKSTPLDDLKLDVDDKCGINWNYAGPSNLCLFVWLMSEIVPLGNHSGSGHSKLRRSAFTGQDEAREVAPLQRLFKALTHSALSQH